MLPLLPVLLEPIVLFVLLLLLALQVVVFDFLFRQVFSVIVVGVGMLGLVSALRGKNRYQNDEYNYCNNQEHIFVSLGLRFVVPLSLLTACTLKRIPCGDFTKIETFPDILSNSVPFFEGGMRCEVSVFMVHCSGGCFFQKKCEYLSEQDGDSKADKNRYIVC